MKVSKNPLGKRGMLLILGLSLLAAVEAASPDRANSAPSRDVGPDRAAAIVQRATGGDVLKVERGKWRGNPSYRVRVYIKEQGLVREVNVDVQTGQLMD